MSRIELDNVYGVHTALFVRINVNQYRANDIDPYGPYNLRFTDHYRAYTINEEEYSPVGRFLKVTASKSELRASANTVTITLAGIPATSITEMIYSRLKSAQVRIYRGFFDVSTNAIIGDPIGRFRGFVNNYSISEEYDIDTRKATNTMVIDCGSSVDILNKKISGRKTNPQSMKRYYPTDISMDKVPNLENASFDFGSRRKDIT